MAASVILTKQLEADANTELQLTHREGGGEPQRRARRKRRAALHVESVTDDGPPDDVVHAGKVGAVRQVEAFRQQLQVGPFTHLEAAGDAHVKVHEVRTQTGVARSADGTVIGGVAVAIQISAGQKVERMSAVVAENRRQLEAG